MQTAIRRLRDVSALAMAWAGAASLAWGGGFAVPSQGARATGQGEAFTAQADDPSATWYNPAGLTQLPGTQGMAGLYAAFPDFQFHSSAGDEQTNEAAYIPHLYAVSDVGMRDWRFGVAVNNVFGISEDWGSSGPLRDIVTSDSLMVINLAPTVAYRVDDHLSFGLGLNIYHGEIELNSGLPLPSGAEGAFRIEGEGEAVGATAGALWRINERNSLGIVCRSPFSIDFDGSARIYLPTGGLIGPSDTNASVDFPAIITAGYAFRPIADLKLEADLEWAGWDTFNDVRIHSDDPRFAALPPRQFDYDDSFTWRFGIEYRFDPAWTARAGYIYSQSATPASTFTPVVVDLDSHIFTAGLSYTRRKWGVDVAYRYIVSVDRDVDHSINSPPGEYSDRANAVMVSLRIMM